MSSLIPPDISRFPMTQALTVLGFPKALCELGFILRHRFLVFASMVTSSVTIPNDQLITSRGPESEGGVLLNKVIIISSKYMTNLVE